MRSGVRSVLARSVLVATVLLAATLAALASAQAQLAGATYEGELGVVVRDSCGGGTIALTVAGDGSAVTQVVLDRTLVQGIDVNTVSEPDGPLTIRFDPGLAIAADGTFGDDFEVVPGIRGSMEGAFAGASVSGTLSGPLGCVGIPFSAETHDVQFVAAATPTAEHDLPPAGDGPPASGSTRWLLMALALGIAGLAGVSVATLARRRS